MGVMDAMKEKMDEEERKIIRDIVKALPLVPDQARLCVAAYARPLAPGWRSCVLGYARCGARRALGSLGCTRQRAAHVYKRGGLALCRNCTLGAPRLLSRGSRAAVCVLWRRARARWRCGSLPRREEGRASAKWPTGPRAAPAAQPCGSLAVGLCAVRADAAAAAARRTAPPRLRRLGQRPCPLPYAFCMPARS
jgi:hypothetical protein